MLLAHHPGHRASPGVRRAPDKFPWGTGIWTLPCQQHTSLVADARLFLPPAVLPQPVWTSHILSVLLREGPWGPMLLPEKPPAPGRDSSPVATHVRPSILSLFNHTGPSVATLVLRRQAFAHSTTLASSGPGQHWWGSLHPHFGSFLSFSCVFGVCEPPCSFLAQLPSWTLRVMCPPVTLSITPARRSGGGARRSGLARELGPKPGEMRSPKKSNRF